MTTTIKELLDFWFCDQHRRYWFKATRQFDQLLHDRFEPAVTAASRGWLDDWRETPQGCLALVILLDQIPLNIYRGSAQSFATEATARQVARQAIDAGMDASLNDAQKAFLYIPFMHSESLADQDYAVQLFEQAGLSGNLRWAKHHRELIRRFGRFPHRNAILGRPDSEEEIAYLNSEGAFTG